MVDFDEFWIYELIGEDGFVILVGVFYWWVVEDLIFCLMYLKDDFVGVEKCFCDFFVFWFGGLDIYFEECGYLWLRMWYMLFKID